MEESGCPVYARPFSVDSTPHTTNPSVMRQQFLRWVLVVEGNHMHIKTIRAKVTQEAEHLFYATPLPGQWELCHPATLGRGDTAQAALADLASRAEMETGEPREAKRA